MRERGQAALEFIMLVLIIIIYLLTITRPLVGEAKGLTSDIQTVLRADSETKRISNSITEVSLMGKGTKKTLTLAIPSFATIYCRENKIGFSAELGTKPYPSIGNCENESCCSDGMCDKNYSFPSRIKLDCQKERMEGKTNIILYNNGKKGENTSISVTG